MKKYIIVLILFLTSCIYDPAPAIIEVVNHTDHNINILWNIDTVPEYPSINHTEYYYSNVLLVNDTLDAMENGASGWKRFLLNSKNKKVNFFVFSADSLKAHNSIDDLILKRLYKRLEYSEEDLIKSNWQVVIKD
ncbi:hypothetical protein [Pedobacter cryoconitis]|uniref:hypothetical protein n=1 Tax=Pedobacter cryoconitis TaxID=188932 RepID=UPI00160CE235|nr:hypothetical protein [Pedobacter cryoconitis]MBB5646545.1 PBP1b-binding outer membrane lipoprotein LpoB [Pedobacter cryoconitis]